MKRPLRITLALALLLVAGGAIASVWFWKPKPSPEMPLPPAISLDGLDTELREAFEKARTRVEQEPRSSEAWGNLGKLLRATSSNEKASFCFAQAESLEPKKLRWPYLRGEALMLAEPEAALPHLRRAAELADRTEPDNLVPHLRLLELLLATGRQEEAEECLHHAQQIEPDNINVVYRLGLMASVKGEFEESRRLLLRCQHSPFTRQKAAKLLAPICERLGRKEEAEQFQQKSRELPPDDGWTDPYVMDFRQAARSKTTRIQSAERLASQGKIQEAAEKLQEVLADGPDFHAYVGLGLNLGRLGDHEGAERNYKLALELRPESAKVHSYLSHLYLTRGEHYLTRLDKKAKAEEQFKLAADSARDALAHKSNDATAHLLLGQSLKRLGKSADAIVSFRAAISCNPEMAEPYLHLGDTLADTAQADEARKHLARFLRLAKADDPLRKQAEERLTKLP